jgi:Xaa-Pro aminopeptidase
LTFWEVSSLMQKPARSAVVQPPRGGIYGTCVRSSVASLRTAVARQAGKPGSAPRWGWSAIRPALAVPPFPGTICTAVNEEIVHGIPGPMRLRDGDIVGIDIGATLGGWVGDTCYTFPVGDPPLRAACLARGARECLEAGIA